MGPLLNELVVYLIKFIVFLACAFIGVKVGGKIRKNKNEKLASENANQ